MVKKNELGMLIKNSSAKKGLNTNQLAKRINVGSGTITKWQEGQIVNLKLDSVRKLTEILDIDPYDFLEPNNIGKVLSNDVAKKRIKFTLDKMDIDDDDKEKIISLIDSFGNK